MIGKIVTVKIDRPLGSAHPKHPDLIYHVNYGYVDGVIAPDGEEQDAYVIGVNVPVLSFEGRIIAIIHRKNDIEDKWVVEPQNMIFTKKEIQNLTHFQEKYFDIEIITE
jgi:inorganic pyrophosphatase